MNIYLTFGIIFVVLFILELAYFKIADHFNIIDKPNERSSHSSIVLRGGGVIFLIGAWVWSAFFGFPYIWFLIGLTLVAGTSFVDDVRSLPDSVRLVIQFVAMAMMFYQLNILHLDMWWVVVLALIICVGATNIINFMDGINGITGAYAFASLIPLLILNSGLGVSHFVRLEVSDEGLANFTDQSLIYTVMLADIVFCIFNFRPRGKAKCFAGDVGSISVAFILLFLIGGLIIKTADPTYLIFLVVYGFDGCLTICHRIMLHENIGQAHRKHAFQLMANELKMSHITVSLFYALLQLAISLVFIFVIPNTIVAHVVYLLCVSAILVIAYLLFMKKYYHLHEEYLDGLKKND